MKKLIIRTIYTLFFILVITISYAKEFSEIELIDSVELDFLTTKNVQIELWKNKLWLFDELPSISILDLDGNLLEFYDSKGNGPGEFQSPFMIIQDRKNDYISFLDAGKLKSLNYSEAGRFLSEEKIDLFKLPFKHIFLNNKNELNYWSEFLNKGDKYYNRFLIEVGDNKIFDFSYDFDEYLIDFLPVLYVGKNNIYLSDTRKDKYVVNVYDLDGIKQKEITKKYSEQAKSEDKIKQIKKELSNTKTRYKKEFGLKSPILQMFEFDNNIWVLTSNKKSDFFFDVFDKEGSFLGNTNFLQNQIHFDHKSIIPLVIAKDKIYIINDQTESIFLDIYQIKENK